ncbi:MAG TPA: hypothetical protein VGN36_00525, partial [Sphingorhabdus sp.]|nr:hypothetical protein [Sphingorhabdus sp.]
MAANAPENLVERYAAARIADIAEQDRIALDGYLKLYKQAPDSEILADRLFDSAIRAGDMATAVRAARALELQNGGSNETALLLFADAWRAKNWRMAGLAADELEAGGSLAFMAPMLKSWVNVAQGRSAGLPEADAEADGFFAYYSADQRIYLDLASGQHTKAKLGLRNIAGQSGDHVRDVMIAGVHVFLEQDRAFAAALMRSAVGSTDVLPEKATEKLPASQGLAALYARISAALTEQQLPAEGLLLARIADWIAPSQANIQLILVGALRGEGLTADALKMLERTQPASAYRLPLLEKRIDLLIASGNAASALDIARHAAAISPKSVATKLLVARAHDAAGNLAAVVSTYREITGDSDFSALVPRQQGAYRLLLAVALDRAGDWASA